MTIDSSAVVRISFGVVAAGLLVAVIALVLRERKLRPRKTSWPLLTTLLLVSLLVALAAASALRPLRQVAGLPAEQVALGLAAVALFSVTLHGRQTRPDSTARLLDTPTVDALTRIASHRMFQDRLAYECDRAHRLGDTFLLLLFDLDDFRPINERFGHRVGDRVLLESARRLRAQLREIDLVARFGADRFALVLPHTFEKAGREVAERLRQSMASRLFPTSEGEVRLTASVGLAVFPDDATSPSALVDAATKALELAKALGGNQVQSYRDLPARDQGGNLVALPHSGREAVVRSLAEAVDIRDGYTRRHSYLVSRLSAAVARHIGLPAVDISRISVGALLHDVGKIGVPDAILTKEGSLTDEEWECIRRHPALGKRIIEQAPELTDVMPLVLHHQERWDGTGYPAGLRGEDIPLGARIIAAADAYHAIRSDRPYRPGRTHRQALKELRRSSGTQLDPRVVDALIAALEGDARLRDLLPAWTDNEDAGSRHEAAAPALSVSIASRRG
jgi:diguanylate cyclase (GGDEF)-like protein